MRFTIKSKEVIYEAVILIFCSFIYIINKNFNHIIEIPVLKEFCQCYLNDIVCGIAFPPYINVVLIFFKYYQLKELHYLLSLMLCFGILWEYFFPLFIPYMTSDSLDILCYVFGAFIYWLLAKAKEK